VEQAIQPDRLELVNDSGPLRSRGAEMLIGFTSGPVHTLANATYLDVTETDPLGGRRRAELIPRYSAELAIIVEDEQRGRIGMEIQYTGGQALNDNPYRTASRSYLEINALAEVRFGRAALFANALNLTNVRQRDDDPLLRPAPGLGAEPITDAWAPLIGRTFNLGVRLAL
jgi:outer membrane receptor for ferrienterochelin and colicins